MEDSASAACGARGKIEKKKEKKEGRGWRKNGKIENVRIGEMFRVLGDIPPVFLVAYRIFGLVGQFGWLVWLGCTYVYTTMIGDE